MGGDAGEQDGRGPAPRRTGGAGRGGPAARAAASALLALVLLLGPGTGTATAHVSLVASSPGHESTVGVVDELVLEFSGSVQADVATVELSGPTGPVALAAAPTARDGVLTQPLPARLDAGAHTVAYRVLAADGHLVTGTLRFTVRPPAPAGGSPSSADPGPAAAPATLAPASGAGTGAAGPGGRVVAWTGGLGLLVVLTYLLVSRRRATRLRTPASRRG